MKQRNIWIAALLIVCAVVCILGIQKAITMQSTQNGPSPPNNAAATQSEDTVSGEGRENETSLAEDSPGQTAGDRTPTDISTGIFQMGERAIGSGTLSRCYFSDTGWYCYLVTDFGIHVHGEIISQRGKWSMADGRMTLSVEEETTAEGGEFTDDVIAGRRITGYKVVLHKVDRSETFDYAIKKDDIGDYIQLGEQQFFPSIPYNEAVKVFTEEGYDAFDALPAEEKQGLWQLNRPK